MKPNSGTVIEGATYFDKNAQHYTINSGGGSIHYKHSQTVLNEVACAGLFDDGTTNETVITGTPTLKYKANYSNPIASMVSQTL